MTYYSDFPNLIDVIYYSYSANFLVFSPVLKVPLHYGFENEGPEDELLNGDNDNNPHDEEIPHGFEDLNS